VRIIKSTDTQGKLSILGIQSRFDLCAPFSLECLQSGFPGIYYAISRGYKVPLLKVLYTNECSRGCKYCALSALIDAPRTRFAPLELVRLFLDLNKRSAVFGLFLSSGIPDDPEDTMEEMIFVARMLRKRGFTGYIHLKILPGVSADLAKEAKEVATRVSVNLEAPSDKRLKHIAPKKSIKREILPILPVIKGSFTTQFVVGPAKEKDIELLATVKFLKDEYGLKRAYFKAFEPIPNTLLEHHPPGSKIRQLRLYQAEHLVRCYGFSPYELVEKDGDLPLDEDPKIKWAKRHPELFPIDLKKADYEELLRIPGIGPRTAKLIIKTRKETTLDINSLKKMRVNLKKCLAFALLDGKPLRYEDLPLLRFSFKLSPHCKSSANT